MLERSAAQQPQTVATPYVHTPLRCFVKHVYDSELILLLVALWATPSHRLLRWVTDPSACPKYALVAMSGNSPVSTMPGIAFNAA